MENFLYTCLYCGKDYKPNRRKKQKYCSNSCRVSAFKIKKEIGLGLLEKETDKKTPVKIEKMSLAGVGNAAAGTLAINALTSMLTKEDNKPATKKDIKDIKNLLVTRYHEIKNMKPAQNGHIPFYDIQTKQIVYLNNKTNART